MSCLCSWNQLQRYTNENCSAFAFPLTGRSVKLSQLQDLVHVVTNLSFLLELDLSLASEWRNQTSGRLSHVAFPTDTNWCPGRTVVNLSCFKDVLKSSWMRWTQKVSPASIELLEPSKTVLRSSFLKNGTRRSSDVQMTNCFTFTNKYHSHSPNKPDEPESVHVSYLHLFIVSLWKFIATSQLS